jgi:hypothetical protein
MSKDNRYYNPSPKDYTIENITATTTETPNTHKENQKNQLHSKVYSRPSENTGQGKPISNSSKSHSGIGSTDNNDPFDYKDSNKYDQRS